MDAGLGEDRCSEDKVRLRELVEKDEAYKEMDEDAYDAAVTFAKAEELLEIKKFHEKGGKVDMCKALEDMLADERMEGIEQGIKALIETCKEFGVSKEEILVRGEKKFSISLEEIRRLVDKYF